MLTTHGVANLRTLEQKISDAGPYGQRVQPHILTEAKNDLVEDGTVVLTRHNNAQWLHRADEDPQRVTDRTAELLDVWTKLSHPSTSRRTGQALEIALYRSLPSTGAVTVFNGFTDLEAHDDATLYTKHEVHVLAGKSLGNRAMDFVGLVNGEIVGIEAKNIRPWLYPNEEEVRQALQKATTLGVLPVLVARRIPYVTFRILGACGVLMHETYNQRLANADAEIASRAAHKDFLGYHDIRIGNATDARLDKFTGENLPSLVIAAKAKFVEYSDLLERFAWGDISYQEFAARVRRRENGQKEDNDWPEDEDPSY